MPPNAKKRRLLPRSIEVSEDNVQVKAPFLLKKLSKDDFCQEICGIIDQNFCWDDAKTALSAVSNRDEHSNAPRNKSAYLLLYSNLSDKDRSINLKTAKPETIMALFLKFLILVIYIGAGLPDRPKNHYHDSAIKNSNSPKVVAIKELKKKGVKPVILQAKCQVNTPTAQALEHCMIVSMQGSNITNSNITGGIHCQVLKKYQKRQAGALLLFELFEQYMQHKTEAEDDYEESDAQEDVNNSVSEKDKISLLKEISILKEKLEISTKENQEYKEKDANNRKKIARLTNQANENQKTALKFQRLYMAEKNKNNPC